MPTPSIKETISAHDEGEDLPRMASEPAEEGMPGILKAMKWSYDCFYVKGHNNADERETYISCLEDDLPKLFGEVDDLVALVNRLARALRKAAPGNDLADKAVDYLRRKGLQSSPLRALSAAPQSDGWRPIAEAPKDGSRFLAFYNGRVEFFRWQESKLFPKDPVGWRDSFINVYREGTGPTHWMPLPTPPKMTQGEAS